VDTSCDGDSNGQDVSTRAYDVESTLTIAALLVGAWRAVREARVVVAQGLRYNMYRFGEAR